MALVEESVQEGVEKSNCSSLSSRSSSSSYNSLKVIESDIKRLSIESREYDCVSA